MVIHATFETKIIKSGCLQAPQLPNTSPSASIMAAHRLNGITIFSARPKATSVRQTESHTLKRREYSAEQYLIPKLEEMTQTCSKLFCLS